MAPTFRSVFAHPSRRLPMPSANESSTDEWHNAQVMPTLVSCPELLTLPTTPTTALSRSSSIVTAGLDQVHVLRFQRGDVVRRQGLDVDLESHGQGRLRTDSRNCLMHTKDVRPELFVAECVEAEDGPAVHAGLCARQWRELRQGVGQEEYEHPRGVAPIVRLVIRFISLSFDPSSFF